MHVSNDLRNAFVEAVERGDLKAAHSTARYLMRCSDIMPEHLCRMLDLPPGCTFAKGALKPAAAMTWDEVKALPPDEYLRALHMRQRCAADEPG